MESICDLASSRSKKLSLTQRGRVYSHPGPLFLLWPLPRTPLLISFHDSLLQLMQVSLQLFFPERYPLTIISNDEKICIGGEDRERGIMLPAVGTEAWESSKTPEWTFCVNLGWWSPEELQRNYHASTTGKERAQAWHGHRQRRKQPFRNHTPSTDQIQTWDSLWISEWTDGWIYLRPPKHKLNIRQRNGKAWMGWDCFHNAKGELEVEIKIS